MADEVREYFEYTQGLVYIEVRRNRPSVGDASSTLVERFLVWRREQGIEPFMMGVYMEGTTITGFYYKRDAQRIFAWLQDQGVNREGSAADGVEILHQRTENTDWGKDRIGTRIRNIFDNYGVTRLAHVLLITGRDNGYYLMYRRDGSESFIPQVYSAMQILNVGNVGVSRLRNYGRGTHTRVLAVLNELGIDPEMNLEGFDWESLRLGQ